MRRSAFSRRFLILWLQVVVFHFVGCAATLWGNSLLQSTTIFTRSTPRLAFQGVPLQTRGRSTYPTATGRCAHNLPGRCILPLGFVGSQGVIDPPATTRSSSRLYSRSIPYEMPRGVKKENLPSKICVTCGRPFTWRKKWEKVWDEVTTCSKSCNHKRRVAKRNDGRRIEGDEDGQESTGSHELDSPLDDGSPSIDREATAGDSRAMIPDESIIGNVATLALRTVS